METSYIIESLQMRGEEICVSLKPVCKSGVGSRELRLYRLAALTTTPVALNVEVRVDGVKFRAVGSSSPRKLMKLMGSVPLTLTIALLNVV